jgi:peptidyl-prolyl cis-trans isomerase SurA
LAVRHSNGSKALNGGDLGWLKQAEIPTFFAEAISGLKTSDVSKVIQSPSGFHIIKVIDQQDNALQLIKEYHLHRFIILSDNANQQNIPTHIMELASALKNQEDFNGLTTEFPDIPAEVNADSDLGWKSIDTLPSPIRTAVANLEKIELYHRSQRKGLDDFIPPRYAYYRPKRQLIKRQQAMQVIRMRKANEMFDLWLRRIKDEAFIKIRL